MAPPPRRCRCRPRHHRISSYSPALHSAFLRLRDPSTTFLSPREEGEQQRASEEAREASAMEDGFAPLPSGSRAKKMKKKESLDDELALLVFKTANQTKLTLPWIFFPN